MFERYTIWKESGHGYTVRHENGLNTQVETHARNLREAKMICRRLNRELDRRALRAASGLDRLQSQ